ncbi:MAG: ABC transporter substrate-binding protein [Myxococcales bacterium]
MDNQASELKRRYDKGRLRAVAEREGLKLSRDGRIQCPARCSDDPRGASVSDTANGGVWQCKRCGKGGSVIDLVMASKGLELRAAIEQLGAVPTPAPTAHVQRPPVDGSAFWPKLAAQDPSGGSYLQGRGLGPAAALVRFNTGRTGDPWLDEKAGRGYRVAVPMRDVHGNVATFQLRSIRPDVQPKFSKLSLPGPQRKDVAFGHPELARSAPRVYLAEGMADTLAGSGRRVRKTEPLHVKGLEAVDSHTLRIRLEAPDLSFLHVMAMPFAYVVAREQVERWGDDYFQHPIGTGPYVLKSWRRSTRIVYAPNPFYDRSRPDAPRLSGVDVQVGADEILQQMMFERGELDYLAAIPDPDFVRITTSPKWKPYVVSMPTCATRYLSLNTEMEPFTDVRVRQAVCHAVNKERLLKIIKGQGVAAHTVLPPNMMGYDPALRPYDYNPGKARALLAAAGKSSGLTVPLWLSIDDNRNVRIGQAVQQDLAEVGIKVELKAVAGTIFQEAAGRRKNAAFGLNAWYQDYPDPSNFLDVLLNGERITDAHSNNKAFYSNPEVNALLNRAAVETDPEERLKLYRQAERRIMADAPWACLYHPKVYMMRQPWIHGLQPNPVWPVRYERLWIERT